MTRDPHGRPPDPRTAPRHIQGQFQPVEPPPTVKQPARPDQPPLAPVGRRPDLDPDRWGYGGYTPPPAAPPPGPPPPATPSRHGRAWLAAVIAIVLVGVAVVVIVVFTRDDTPATVGSPSTTVQTYLRDLAAHDATDALAQGAVPTVRTFLTDDILRRQQLLAPISDVHLGPTSTNGDHARVRARYRFGSRAADTTYALTRTGGRWQLDQTTFRIDVSMLGVVPSPTVFDRPVGGVRTIDVFPGPVQWGSGNRYFVVSQKNADRFALSPSDPDASYAEISSALNPSGVAAVQDATAAYVKACTSSKSLRPPKCPQQEYGDHAIKNSATWTVTTPLQDALRLGPSQDELTTITVEANLRLTCVYSVPAAKGRTRRVTDRTVQGSISGSVDLTAAKPAFSTSI